MSARVVVIGDLDATRLLCSLLTDQGARAVHLLDPSEGDLDRALAAGADAVAIVVRGDLLALRFALLVEHLAPGVPLVATIFDRTLGEHLARVVPHCTVTSPAAVAAPSIAAACIRPSVLAIMSDEDGARELIDGPEGPTLRDWTPRPLGLLGRASRYVPRRYGGAEGLLLLGAAGLASIVAIEWILAAAVLHEGVVRGFYTSIRLAATVGPANADTHEAPPWYLVISALLMLAGIASTGALVAGLVEWIVSVRTAALVGARRVPTHDHVVVAGLGQVGLRVAMLLRELGAQVVVVEQNRATPNLAIAKSHKIPVVFGDAASKAVLTRVGAPRAISVAALGSDDLGNIAVAINGLAVAPGARAVLRAGEGATVTETMSLFRIGQVANISALTAAWVSASVRGEDPLLAYREEDAVGVLTARGRSSRPVPAPCPCRSGA